MMVRALHVDINTQEFAHRRSSSRHLSDNGRIDGIAIGNVFALPTPPHTCRGSACPAETATGRLLGTPPIFVGIAATDDGGILVGYWATAPSATADGDGDVTPDLPDVDAPRHVLVAKVAAADARAAHASPPPEPRWHAHSVTCGSSPDATTVTLRRGAAHSAARPPHQGGTVVAPGLYCDAAGAPAAAAGRPAVLLLDDGAAAQLEPEGLPALADHGEGAAAVGPRGGPAVAALRARPADSLRGATAAAVPAGTPATAAAVRIARCSGGVWVAIVGRGVATLGGSPLATVSYHQLILARLGTPAYAVVAVASVDTVRSLAPRGAWGGVGGGGVGLSALVVARAPAGGDGGVYVFGNVEWGGIDFGGGAPLQQSGYGTCGFAARYSAAAAHVASRYICGRGDTEVTAAVRSSAGGAVVAITTRAAELGGPHEGVVGETAAWHRRAGGTRRVGVSVLLATMGPGGPAAGSAVGVIGAREWVVRHGLGEGDGDDAAYDARVHALAEDCGHAAYGAATVDQEAADSGYIAVVEVGGAAGADTLLEIDTLTRITAAGGKAAWAVVALDARLYGTRAVPLGGSALVWWGRNGAESGPPVAMSAGTGWYRGVGVVSDGRGGWWVCGSGSGTVAHHTMTSGAADGTEYEIYVHYGLHLVTTAGITIGATSGAAHLRVRACAPDGAGGVVAVSDYDKAHTRGGDALIMPSGPAHHAVTRISAGGVVSYVGLARAAAAVDAGWGRVHDVTVTSVGGVCTAVAGGHVAAAAMTRLHDGTGGPLDHHGQVVGVAVSGAACGGAVAEGSCGAAGRTTTLTLPVGMGSGARRVVAVGMDDGAGGGYYVAVQGEMMSDYAGNTAGMAALPSQLVIARYTYDHGVIYVKLIEQVGGTTPFPYVRLVADGAGGVWVGGTIIGLTLNCLDVASGLPPTTARGGSDVFLIRIDAGARVHVCAQHGSASADSLVDLTVTPKGGILLALNSAGVTLNLGGAAIPAPSPAAGVDRGVVVDYTKVGVRRGVRVYAAASGATSIGGVATVGAVGRAGGTACGKESYYISLSVGSGILTIGGYTIPAASEGLYVIRAGRGADGVTFTTDLPRDVYRLANGGGGTTFNGFRLAATLDGTLWACGNVGGGAAVTVPGAGVQPASGPVDELYVRVRVHDDASGAYDDASGGYGVVAARRLAVATAAPAGSVGVRACVADGDGGVWAVSAYEHTHVHGGVNVVAPPDLSSNHLLTHMDGSGTVDEADTMSVVPPTSPTVGAADALDVAINGHCELLIGGTGTNVGSAYSAATSAAIGVTPGTRALLIRKRVRGCGGDRVPVARTVGCTAARALATHSLVRDGDSISSALLLAVSGGVGGGFWAILRGGVGADVYAGVRLGTGVGSSATATVVARHDADGAVVSVGVAACFAAEAATAGPDGGVWVGGAVTAAGGCTCADVGSNGGAPADGAAVVPMGDTVLCFYDRDGRARGQVGIGQATVGGTAVAAALVLRAVGGHMTMSTSGTVVVAVQATASVDALRVAANGGETVAVGVPPAELATHRVAAAAVVVGVGTNGRAVVVDATAIRTGVASPAVEIVAVTALASADAYSTASPTLTWLLWTALTPGAQLSIAIDADTGTGPLQHSYAGGAEYQVVAVAVDARLRGLATAAVATTAGAGVRPAVLSTGDDAGGAWVYVAFLGGVGGTVTPTARPAVSLHSGGGVLLRVDAACAVVGSPMGGEGGGDHQLRVHALSSDGFGGAYLAVAIGVAPGAAEPHSSHVRIGEVDTVAMGGGGLGTAEGRGVVRVDRDGDVRGIYVMGGHVEIGRTTLRSGLAVLDGCRVAHIAATENVGTSGDLEGGTAVGGGAADVRHSFDAMRSDTNVVVYETVSACSDFAAPQAAPALATIGAVPLSRLFVYGIAKGSHRTLWLLATASGISMVRTLVPVTVYPQQHVLIRAPMDLSIAAAAPWGARAFERQHALGLVAHISGHVWVFGTCSGALVASAAVSRTATAKDACVLHYDRTGPGQLLGAAMYGGAGDQGAAAVLPISPSRALVAVQLSASHVRVVAAASPMADGAAEVVTFADGVGEGLDLAGVGGATVAVHAMGEACAAAAGAGADAPRYVIVGTVVGAALTINGVHEVRSAHTFVIRLTRQLALVDHVRVVDGGGFNATALAPDGVGGWWVCGNTDASHGGHIRVGDGLQTGGGAAAAVAVRLEEAVGGRGRSLNVTALWRSGVPATAGGGVHVTCDSDGRGGVWVGGIQITRDAESTAFALRLNGMQEAAVVTHVDGRGKEVYARAMTRPAMGSGGRVIAGALVALDACHVIVGGMVETAGSTVVAGGVTVGADGGLITRMRDAECAAYDRGVPALGTAGGCGLTPVAALRLVTATVLALAGGDGGGYFAAVRASGLDRIGAVALANGATQPHQLVIVRFDAAHAVANARALALGVPLDQADNVFGAIAHDRRGGVWVSLSRAPTAPRIDFGAGPAARRGGVDTYAVHYDTALMHLSTTIVGDMSDVVPADGLVTPTGQFVLLVHIRDAVRVNFAVGTTTYTSELMPFQKASVVYLSSAGTVTSAVTLGLRGAVAGHTVDVIAHGIVYGCSHGLVYALLSASVEQPDTLMLQNAQYRSAVVVGVHPAMGGTMSTGTGFYRAFLDAGIVSTDPDKHSTHPYEGSVVSFTKPVGAPSAYVCARLTDRFWSSTTTMEAAGREQIVTVFTPTGAITRNHTDSDSATLGGMQCSADGAGGVWVAFDYQSSTMRGSLTARLPTGHVSWTAVMHASPASGGIFPNSLFEIGAVGSGGRVTPAATLALPSCDLIVAITIDGADAGVDYGLRGDAGAAVRGSGSSVVALRRGDCEPDAEHAGALGTCADLYTPSRILSVSETTDVSLLGVRRGYEDAYWLAMRSHGRTTLRGVALPASCSGPSQVVFMSIRHDWRDIVACYAGWDGGATDNFATFDMVVTSSGDLWVAGTMLSTSETVPTIAVVSGVPRVATLTRSGPSDVYVLHISTHLTLYGRDTKASVAQLISTPSADEFAGMTLRGSSQVVIVFNTAAASVTLGGQTVALSGAAVSAVVVAVDTTGRVTDLRALTTGAAGAVTAHAVATRCTPTGDEYLVVVEHASTFVAGGAAGTVSGSGVSVIALDYILTGTRSSTLGTTAAAGTLAGTARMSAGREGEVWVYLNIGGGATLTVGGTAYSNAAPHGAALALDEATLGPLTVHHVKATAPGGAHSAVDMSVDSHGAAWVAIGHRGGLAVAGGATVPGTAALAPALLHVRRGASVAAAELRNVLRSATSDVAPRGLTTTLHCEVGVAVQIPPTTTVLVGGQTYATTAATVGLIAHVLVDDCEPILLPPSCVHRGSGLDAPIHVAHGAVTAAAADVNGGFYLGVLSVADTPLLGLRVEGAVAGRFSAYVVRYSGDASAMSFAPISMDWATDRQTPTYGVRALASRADGGVWALIRWAPIGAGVVGTVRVGVAPPRLVGNEHGIVARLDVRCEVLVTTGYVLPAGAFVAYDPPPVMVTTADGGVFAPISFASFAGPISGTPDVTYVGGSVARLSLCMFCSIGVLLDANAAFVAASHIPDTDYTDYIFVSAAYDCVSNQIIAAAVTMPAGSPSTSILVAVDPRTLAVTRQRPAVVLPAGYVAASVSRPPEPGVAARVGGGVVVHVALVIAKLMPDDTLTDHTQLVALTELDAGWGVVRDDRHTMSEFPNNAVGSDPTITAFAATTTGVWLFPNTETGLLASGDVTLGVPEAAALERDASGRLRHAAQISHLSNHDVGIRTYPSVIVLSGSCTALVFATRLNGFTGGGGPSVFLNGTDPDALFYGLWTDAYALVNRRTGQCGKGFVNVCAAFADDVAGCDASVPFTPHVGTIAASAEGGGDWLWSDTIAHGAKYAAIRGSCSGATALQRGDTGASGRGGVGRVDLPPYSGRVDYVGDAVPSAGRGFCQSADADGPALVVGMHGGAALYERGSAAKYLWKQTLADSPAGAEDGFGLAVAYRDGTASGASGWVGTIAVGAPSDISDAVWPLEDKRPSTTSGRRAVGATYVYEHAYPGTANAYVEVAYLKPPARVANGARFGASVSVSTDGRVLVVGVPGDTRDVAGGVGGGVSVTSALASDETSGPAGGGSVVVFARGWMGGTAAAAGDGLWWPTLMLRPQSPVAGGAFGHSVSVDGRGSEYEVAVGAPGEGAVYMYTVVPAGGAPADQYGRPWVSVGSGRGRFVPPVVTASGTAAFGVAMQFGHSVAVGVDVGGVRIAAVGAPRDWRCGSGLVAADESGSGPSSLRCDGRGSVYMYERVAATATYTLMDVFRGAGGVVGGVGAGAGVGAAVSARPAAGGVFRVAVGAPGDDNGITATAGGVVDGVVVGGVASYVPLGNATGAVYVLSRSSGGVWSVDTYTKPPTSGTRDAAGRYGAGGLGIVDVPTAGAVAAHRRVLGCAPGGENVVGGENPRAYMHGRGAVGTLHGMEV